MLLIKLSKRSSYTRQVICFQGFRGWRFDKTGDFFKTLVELMAQQVAMVPKMGHHRVVLGREEAAVVETILLLR